MGNGCCINGSNDLFVVGVHSGNYFTIKYRQSPKPPTLISPAHETFTNDLSPHFLWHSTDSSAWYKLHVSQDPGFGTLWHDGLGPDTTQQVGLTGGCWYWRVRAYSGTDSSDWSAVRALNVDTTYPYPPVLKGPPDMAWVSGGPALGWNWAPGLAQCRVQVSADTNFIAIADSATIADSSFVASLMDGKYFWRVQAADSAGNWSGWGEVRRFRLDASPPTIVSTWPVNGQVLVQPTDTIKVMFSERIVPGSFMYGIDPGVGVVYLAGTGDTMKLWSSGFSLGVSYTVTVTEARDSAGNDLGAGPAPNPFSFTITPDATGPSIVYNNTGASLTPGLPLPIEVMATDPSGMGQVYLYYRRGGEAEFTESAMSLHPGDVYRDTIPGALIGERGISYYFRASDALGSHSALPAGAPAARFHRSAAMDVVTYPFTLSGGSYRMFSVPFNPASPPWRPYELTDDLGAYDDTQWRLFRWQSGAYAEFNAVQDIIPGRAYWVINRVGGTFDLANALSVADSALHIPLASGWNMVGVPFAFTVSAADIMVHDGGGGNYYPILDSNNTVTERRLVEWLGTGYSNRTQMEPWKGYWVKSNYANIYLEIPPVSAMGKVMAAPAQSGWTLALEASCGQYHDRDNRLGITPGGPRDNASEPPVVDGYLSLAFERDGRRLAEDYRTELGSGQSWSFAVGTDQAGPVSLQWSEEGSRGDWQYALYDVTAGRVAGGQGACSYNWEQGGGTRRFVLLAGTPEYLASESGRAGLLPAATRLGQNHPNPFSSRTAVSYQLARPAWVSLAVYNLLGQKVRTLAEGEQGAGRYTADWDGRDQAGRAAGSGVYFLRLEAGGEAFSRRMLLLR